MDHSHGLDKHSINFSLKARRSTVCSWKHALFIQVFIILELLGYLPNCRTKLQCLKQVSRTPCLPWSSSIMCDSLQVCTEIHKNQFNFAEWVLQQYLKYLTLWRLGSDHCRILWLAILLMMQSTLDWEYLRSFFVCFCFHISLNPGNNLHAHNTEFQHTHVPH